MSYLFINPVSEINISYHPKIPINKRAKVASSSDAYNYFLEVFDPSVMNIKEEAAVLYLNRGGRVVGVYKLSSGGITGTVVDIRLILGIALKSLTCGIILAHTHPSGELNPSKADIELTQRLKEAAKIMEISLLDHLILSTEAFYSFADEGCI